MRSTRAGPCTSARSRTIFSYDLPAAAYASPEMLSALSDAISALSGKTYTLDMQMQSALEICRLAAAKPQQYSVRPDGTWKRNS